jgi:uncharacterized membrane protein YkoI
MIARKMITPVLLAAQVWLAPPAFAAQQGAARAPAEQEVSGVLASKTQLNAFATVKVSLAEAIAAAEAYTKGGRLLDVSFDVRRGKPIYKVKTYQNSATWEGIVDARSAGVIDKGKTTPESKLDDEDKAELAGLQKATTPLAQAVKVAEQHGGGKAIAAGLEETNGKIVYEVTIVKDGVARKLVVDPSNGQVAQD